MGRLFGEFFNTKENNKVRKVIDQAFDEENGEICFKSLNAIKKLNNTQKNTIPTGFPKQLFPEEHESLYAFNQRVYQYIKRQDPIDPFSSALDWSSERRYPHYKIVKQPLVKDKIFIEDDSSNNNFLMGKNDSKQNLEKGTLYFKVTPPESIDVELIDDANDVKLIGDAKKKSKINFKDIGISKAEKLTDGVVRENLSKIRRKLNIQESPSLYLKLRDDNDTLDYSIRNSNGEVVDGSLQLHGCYLISFDKENPKENDIKKFYKEHERNDFPEDFTAIIKTPLGFYQYHKSTVENDLELIPNNDQNDLEKLGSLFKNTAPVRLASREERQSIYAAIPQIKLFEPDVVTACLVSDEKNQYNQKLDVIINRILKKTLTENSIEAFDPNELYYSNDSEPNKSFYEGLKKLNITNSISNNELFRYYIAYVSLLNDAVPEELEKLKKAFFDHMVKKIIHDTLVDLRTLLEQSKPAYPKETSDLIDFMIDEICQKDEPVQARELKELLQLVDTTWARGTAFTADTNKEALSSPTALPLDAESVPNYASFENLLKPFEVQIKKYNADLGMIRAHNALKTTFRIPDDKAEWLRIKQNARNCLVLYKGELYHINSDKTSTKLNLNENIKAKIKDKNKNYEIKDAPLSKGEWNKLTENKIYFIYHEKSNTYSIAYKDNRYQEEPLIAADALFDPNLSLARETLAKAQQGITYSDYAKATLGQLPPMGKYFSSVYKGELQILGQRYEFEAWNNQPSLVKGKIYLSKDNKGNLFYSMIAATGDKIIRHKLKSSVTTNILGRDGDTREREMVLAEITQNGHILKRLDPTTMAAKLGTEAGYKDSMKKYRRAREKRRATYEALTSTTKEDTRQAAFSDVTNMAKGDLTSNKSLPLGECGIKWDYYSADDFKKYLEDNEEYQGKGKHMYVLQLNDKSEPVGLFLVDRSNAKPVVTELKAKETGFDKSTQNAADMVGKMKAKGDAFISAQVKEDQASFLKGIFNTIAAAARPELFLQEEQEDSWVGLGLKQAQEGCLVFHDPNVITHAAWNDSQNQKRKGEFLDSKVPDQHSVCILTLRDKTSPEENILVCRGSDGKVKQIKLNRTDKVINQLIEEMTAKPPKNCLSKEVIDALNQILMKAGSEARVPVRKGEISIISPELEEAINAETKEYRLKHTAYTDRLDAYAHNETFQNRLSSVLAQRQELWERYKIFLEKEKITLLDAPLQKGEPVADGETKIYFDAQKQKWTRFVHDKTSRHKEEDYKNEGYLETLQTLNRDMLVEQYQLRTLTQDEYNELIQWKENLGEKLKEKPPILLEKGILYVYDDGNKCDCLGIDCSGQLKFTGMIIPSDEIKLNNKNESESLKNLFKYTEKHGITLEAKLVSPVFLNRCKESQRFLDQIAHQAFEWFAPREGILPVEKREKILEMMAKIAIDPSSPEAAHYLRDSHKMYITNGLLDAKDRKDKDPTSFYLDVSDRKALKLYHFNERGQQVLIHMKSNHENVLYKIAEAQFGKGKVLPDSEVQLSSRDVYYHITNKSLEYLKMDTALEMIEEIYQSEFGLAKTIESVIIALMTLAMGAGTFFMQIPAMGVFFTFVGKAMAMIVMASCALASLICVENAVSRNSWFDSGLSSLRQSIAELKTVEAIMSESNKKNVGLIGTVEGKGTSAVVQEVDTNVSTASSSSPLNPLGNP